MTPMQAHARRPFRSLVLCASLGAGGLTGLSACGPTGAEPNAAPEAGEAVGEGWTQEAVEALSLEIQGAIEELAGQPFKSPVAVKLSDGAGFVRYATERMERLVPPQEFERDADAARLLGLIPPDMDLLAVTMGVLEEQVGGFYDPASDTFYLMESFTGPLARVILAHELTHALDDQYFDLDAEMAQVATQSDGGLAYSSIVEGSAMVLMTKWTMREVGAGRLDPAELMNSDTIGVEAAASSPAFIWKPLLGAYMAGQAFFMSGYSIDKKAAKQEQRKADINALIARAYAAPPRSMEQVVHPEKYWSSAERDDPRRVQHPGDDLPEGWEIVSRDTLGELYLALFLEDPEDLVFPDATTMMAMSYTNPGASGWDGDELLLLKHATSDAQAVRVASVWDDADEAAEFAAAVEASRERLELGVARLAEVWGDGAAHGLRVLHEPGSSEVSLLLWAGAPAEALATLAFQAD